MKVRELLKKGFYGTNGLPYQNDNGPGIERCFIVKSPQNGEWAGERVFEFPKVEIETHSKNLGDGYSEGTKKLFVNIEDIPKEYLKDNTPKTGKVLWGEINW